MVDREKEVDLRGVDEGSEYNQNTLDKILKGLIKIKRNVKLNKEV